MMPLTTGLTICIISNGPNWFSGSSTDKYLTKHNSDYDSFEETIIASYQSSTKIPDLIYSWFPLKTRKKVSLPSKCISNPRYPLCIYATLIVKVETHLTNYLRKRPSSLVLKIHLIK